MEQWNRTTTVNSTYSRIIKKLCIELFPERLSFDFNHVSTPNGTVSAHQRNENTLLLLDSLLHKVYEKRPVTQCKSHMIDCEYKII